jgi:signal transduction histidine kinase
MPRSFAVRLALSFAAVGVGAAVLTAVLVNVAFDRRFDDYVSEQRRQGQEQLVSALESSYRRGDRWEPTDLASVGAAASMNGLAFRVEDASGGTVWSSLDESSTGMAQMHREMMATGPLGPERRVPVAVDGERVGAAVVRLPQGGLRPQDLSLRASVNRLLATGGIVAGLASLAVGLVLARRVTAPVAELTASARRLAAGDRSQRLSSDRNDELGQMGRAFNQMADSIEEEDQLRKGFAADVAHELRTPLTILQTQVEALQDGVAAPSPVAFSSLHDEILRLSRLVADLETLASADAATFDLDCGPVALRPLLEDAAQEFAGVFAERGLRLVLHLDDDIEIEADATRVRQVTANLLANATKFTPPGGEVRLELERDGPWAVIRVVDTGPGIPADEMSSVFDRFFRGRDVRTGGSGIGLAIVRRLVAAHGGDVEVASEPGDGATFTVRLPQTARSLLTPFTGPS